MRASKDPTIGGAPTCTFVELVWGTDVCTAGPTLAALVELADPLFSEFGYEVEARGYDWAHWTCDKNTVAVRVGWELPARERWAMRVTGHMPLRLAERLLSLVQGSPPHA
jgi:hypothetical protein